MSRYLQNQKRRQSLLPSFALLRVVNILDELSKQIHPRARQIALTVKEQGVQRENEGVAGVHSLAVERQHSCQLPHADPLAREPHLARGKRALEVLPELRGGVRLQH